MALVTGPLMSLDASGTIGKAITFGHWKGRHSVRTRVIPENPKSAAQTGVRSMMSFLSKAWAAIAALSKATWDDLAESKQITPFNAFVGANLTRWQSNQGPSEDNPAAEASTPVALATFTPSGESGYVDISLEVDTNADSWGVAIFRDTAEITNFSWAKCIAIIPLGSEETTVYTDSPLAAGTYHYRAANINTDGVIGVFAADDDVEVT